MCRLTIDPRHEAEAFYLTSWGREMAKWSIDKFEEIYRTRYYSREETKSESQTHGLEASDSDDDDIEPSTLFSSNGEMPGTTTYSIRALGGN